MFDQDTKLFYGRIVYMLQLNVIACRYNLFDVLLCDTDDTYTYTRFVDTIPYLQHALNYPSFDQWMAMSVLTNGR